MLENRTTAIRIGGITGPILATNNFQAMRLRTGGETAVIMKDNLGNNVWKVGMPVLIDNPCSGIILKCDIIIGGVTFDNGTLSKQLNIPEDLTSSGEYQLDFIKIGIEGSNCHRISMWQGQNRILYNQ